MNATLQEGFAGIEEHLVGIEDAVLGLVNSLRVQLGLVEADEELEAARKRNDDLEVENEHLNEQLGSLHKQLDQVRASIPAPPTPTSAPADASAPTPPESEDQAPDPDVA